jgi:hypothetical protein
MDERMRRSDRDRGMTALIEGFFAFVWFGWGQADASSWLSVALAAGSALAVPVAILGAVRAFRSPAASSVLHGRRGWRRYGMLVGVEFLLAGAGAGVLEATGQDTFVPVWVCAVVGVHFFALAPVLQDRLLVPLGALLSMVAVVALAVGRWTDLAPSTVTGVGAGALLLSFALLALADRPRPRPGRAGEQARAKSSNPSGNRSVPNPPQSTANARPPGGHDATRTHQWI